MFCCTGTNVTSQESSLPYFVRPMFPPMLPHGMMGHPMLLNQNIIIENIMSSMVIMQQCMRQIAVQNIRYTQAQQMPNLPQAQTLSRDVIRSVPALHDRNWEVISEGALDLFSFKIMSYNIMAQIFVDAHILKSCRKIDLSWGRRLKMISDEVCKLDPDILCLQEVQRDHFQEIKDQFEQFGYEGMYKKKTSFNIVDGCAIFYKFEKLSLEETRIVELRHSATNLLRAQNIAIITKFSPKSSPNSTFLTVTTHLVYRPLESKARLAQMRVLLAEIEKHSRSPTGEAIPVVLTGDLNAFPESSVIELLNKGAIKISAAESLEMLGLAEYYSTFATTLCEREVRHPFKLASAYDFKTLGNLKIIDYIYFTSDKLKLLQRLSIPCYRMPGPDELEASDHFSIVAVFELDIRTSSSRNPMVS